MYRYRRITIDILSTAQRGKKASLHLGLAIILGQFSCVAQQGPLSSSAYSEDLSSVRPKFITKNDSIARDRAIDLTQAATYIPAKNTVNTKLDAVLDSIDRINTLKRFVDGFTIQIYSGQNRGEAIAAKSKMVTNMSDMEGNLQYTQPKFRVTTGRYFSKLEAQKDLLQLRRHFSNAILIPEKILIN